ncbi:MAG TPA: hypothetical protein VKT19_03380 [Steroidobacteraceae bacterium]|nr:hypothetical protein [Steroidobacteraceae bacterium]
MPAGGASAYEGMLQSSRSVWMNPMMLKSKGFYWFVVIASSLLLLWGWAIAVKNLINGTTVVS